MVPLSKAIVEAIRKAMDHHREAGPPRDWGHIQATKSQVESRLFRPASALLGQRQVKRPG